MSKGEFSILRAVDLQLQNKARKPSPADVESKVVVDHFFLQFLQMQLGLVLCCSSLPFGIEGLLRLDGIFQFRSHVENASFSSLTLSLVLLGV